MTYGEIRISELAEKELDSRRPDGGTEENALQAKRRERDHNANFVLFRLCAGEIRV